MPITKIFKKLIGRSGTSTGTPERQLPPESRPTPTAGPSRPPREGPAVEITETSEPRGFPNPPVEDIGPPPLPAGSDWMPTSPEVRDPYGTQLSPRGYSLPENDPPKVPEGEALSRAFGPEAIRNPRSFPTPSPPGDLFEGVGWGRPYGGGPPSSGDGGGGPPPHGGGQPPSSGPEPSGGLNYQWYFFLMLVGYALYQWGFQQYRIDFGKRLAEFEKDQQEKDQRRNTDALVVPPQRSVFANQLWGGLRGAGWLMGGLLAGGDLARRAINATILPPLRRIASAIIPRFIRSVLGPLLNTLGKFALIIWSPFSKLALFFGVLASVLGADSSQSLVPLMEPAILWVQTLFEAPFGYSAQVIFISKNIKILISTFFLGGATININTFQRKNNSQSFFVGVFLGTIAVFILLDRRWIYVFVSQYLVQAFPFIEEVVRRPIVKVSAIFGSGVLIQSAQFPSVVSVFYACLLVLSGIWKEVLF